jgi:hypothetical protein
MQQPVAHEQRDAADACWNLDDDDNDRPAETLQLLPGAYPGTVRFGVSDRAGWNRLGTSQVIRVRLHDGPEWGILDGSGRHGWVAAVGSIKRLRRVPLQIELETKQDADSLEGDPDSVP